MTPHGAGRSSRSGAPAAEVIYQPPEGAGEPPWPAILLIPRPVSRTADPSKREGLIPALAAALSERGILAAIGPVGASASSGKGDAPAADPMGNARASLRRLVSRTDVCADRTGIVGHGIGGLIGAALAREAAGISGVCLIASPSPAMVEAGRLDDELSDSQKSALEGLDPFVSRAACGGPTLLVHGAADRRVPLEASHAYRAALENAGRSVEQILVALGDHDFSDDAARDVCIERIVSFFEALVHRAERATA